MKKEKIFSGNSKNIIIGILMLTSLFILLPNFVNNINNIMAPYSDHEVIITTVCYKSEGIPGGKDNIIVGHLYQPSPKFTDKKYPAVIACHGWLMGIGKESMHRWAVEVAKRGFIVLSIDLPGSGMSMGEMDLFPREDFEPKIIEDGIKFLKSYDFVDGSKIGLMGISYGGATVAMAAGVLGNKIDATVVMNGFTNTTNWLIEGLLPDADFKFSVSKDYITLKEVDGKKITKDNIVDFLRLYGIIRGDKKLVEDLIVPGTNKIDREALKKFDAVEHLSNVKNDSVLFLHSKNDGTFSHTNQSGQGYDAILKANKTAHYILLDDNHQLMDDPKYTSDYCLINFFEEKLKGVNLGNGWANDYEKYSQKRNIELTISKTFTFMTLYITLFFFLLSLIPAFAIFNILMYNKTFTKDRAIKEEKILKRKSEDPNFIDFTFGRGSYKRLGIFLGLCYFTAYLFIIGCGIGIFSEIIAGFLCATFYFSLFLSIYYLPDKAEVELKKSIKSNKSRYPIQSEVDDLNETKIFDINNIFSLFGLLSIVIVIALIGSMISQIAPIFNEPFEQIIRTLGIVGLIISIVSILIIYRSERLKHEGITFSQIKWEKYSLSRYDVAKGITYGSLLFLNFIFQYNIWAFYMKFPPTIGPHSIFYALAILGIGTFFLGLNLFIKVIKELVFLDHIKIFRENGKKDYKKLFAIEAISFFIGLSVITIIGYICLFPLLYSIFGDLTIIATTLLIVIYIISYIINVFSSEKSIFGASTFIPIALFTIIAFLAHI
ncbi:MAG: alpha/beta hydrolase family protein [Promethearchaeia archaeon]